MALRRITRELQLMQSQGHDSISARACSPSNLMKWEGIIHGPIDSPYQGGKFKVNIQFPDDYPFNPPTIEFVTPVYHPNISEDGQICLDLLDSNWSPALTISKLLLSLQSLLTDPNIDDPLESQIAEQYRDDKERYDEIAREHTQKYATVQ